MTNSNKRKIKMENKELNLCEILKDCPKGTKLWSHVCGNMTLIQINNVSIYPIVLSADGFNNVSLHSDGRMYLWLYQS